MPDISTSAPAFEFTVEVAIVGGGACGLTAALAASDEGAQVLVLERDDSALGSTAMSTGLIPAAGTPEQRDRDIPDSPQVFLEDILRKTKGQTDEAMARRIAEESADTVGWLREQHAAPLELIDGFLYPGHTHKRMYGTPNRTGAELQGALEAALGRTGADLLTGHRVETLYVEDDRVVGLRAIRGDGAIEDIGCGALILACCGFGANTDMVRAYIPEIADATYFGHPGNTGDAVSWGAGLGAAMADMAGYQGHGGLAVGHGVPILWPLIMEGGIQVNAEGVRFSNEAEGYSEQAAKVNAQPGRIAWSIFDERLHELMMAFDDYRDALRAGAVVSASDVAALAVATGLPADQLAETLVTVEACVGGQLQDTFGRDFRGKPPLTPPYRAAKVTGALF
ncbi:MAG: FAD-dependent oxidoreductase, partial [Phenylobacterium sp.]|nr:FAD-dependent oxidoreductase [Phenylobacterium sp.]